MEEIKTIVDRVVQLLVAQDYESVRDLTHGIRMRTEEIRRAILEYGKTLVFPPTESFDKIDIIEIKSHDSYGVRAWSVRFPLWTKEEGESDLSLELTVIDGKPLKVELDDIHVL